MRSPEETEARLQMLIRLCEDAIKQSEKYPEKRQDYLDQVFTKWNEIKQIEWVLDIEVGYDPFPHVTPRFFGINQ